MKKLETLWLRGTGARKRHIGSLAVLLLAVGLTPQHVEAQEIGYTVWVCPPDVACELPVPPGQPPVPGAAIASDVDAQPLVAGGASVFGSAVAGARSANASVVPAAAGAGASQPPRIRLSTEFATVSDGSAVAFAFWEDEATLNVPGQAPGVLHWITVTFAVRGSIQLFDDFLTGGQSAEWIAGFYVNGNGLGGGGGFCESLSGSGDPQCPGSDYSGTPMAPPGNTVQISFQVANNVPYVKRLAAWTNQQGYLLRGSSDFGSTIDWVSLEVRDLANEPVTDFTLTSASGIDWTLPSESPAPVPALHALPLLTLLTGALVGVALVAGRHRNLA